MTKINSLNITDIKYNLNNPKIKELLKYINISLKNQNNDFIIPENLIPNNIKHNVKINFKDTSATLVNSIRKSLLEQIPVKSLTFDVEDLKSNELYLLYDELKIKIESIPIYQHITEDDINNFEFSLNVTNNNIYDIKIYSHDIQIFDKKNNSFLSDKEKEKYIPKNIILFGETCNIICYETRTCIGEVYEAVKYGLNGYLLDNINLKYKYDKYILKNGTLKEGKYIMDLLDITKVPDIIHLYSYKEFNRNLSPGNFIKIPNLKIVEGTGENDYNMFSSVSGFSYSCNSSNKSNKSSLELNNTNYTLGYTTYGNVKPLYPLNLSIDYLTNKLNNILNIFENNIDNNNDIPYIDNFIHFISIAKKNNVIYKLIIKNNYRIISDLISKYIFIFTEGGIKFVSSSIKHPDINESYVIIDYDKPIVLIKNAIKLCLKDLNNIKNDIQ